MDEEELERLPQLHHDEEDPLELDIDDLGLDE